MRADELAESMLDGSLGYSPMDDAVFIAKQYLEVHKVLTSISEWTAGQDEKLLPLHLRLKMAVILNVDPARRVNNGQGE